jgi:hypothetical protein
MSFGAEVRAEPRASNPAGNVEIDRRDMEYVLGKRPLIFLDPEVVLLFWKIFGHRD